MNFKPTKLKVMISVILIVIWYAYIFLGMYHNYPYCEMCPQSFNPRDCPSCSKVFILEIIPDNSDICTCFCSCPSPTPFSKVISDLFIVLIPGILTYIIWSLFQKKEEVGNKKKRGKNKK